jgi:hypothetical protein
MLLIITEVDARGSVLTGTTSYNKYRALLNTGYSIGIDNSGYNGKAIRYLPYDPTDFATGGIKP